ncbi:unnamed protein product [Cochlearia groenlandica]
MIPASYYDELPSRLPESAILQRTGGCFWRVAMMKKRDEVYFGQGWSKFVVDNHLIDGDILSFVYDGDHIFEVSIYGSGGGCKETRDVAEIIEVQEDSVCSLSSGDINTSSEPEMTKKTVPRSRSKGLNTFVKLIYLLNFCVIAMYKHMLFFSVATKTGKDKVVEEDYDEDSERETFRSDSMDDSNNDSSYSPGDEDTITYVKPKATHLRKKGKTHLLPSLGIISTIFMLISFALRFYRRIMNPEAYLDNPENAHFETRVQTRPFELLVPRQLVRDYCLKFQNFVSYIDNHKAGELEAKTVQWSEQRVCIKKWNHICERNNVKKEDAILCELLRKRNVVYAVKIHIIREKGLKNIISIVLD